MIVTVMITNKIVLAVETYTGTISCFGNLNLKELVVTHGLPPECKN